MLPNDILRIMREDKDILEMFRLWDETGIDPFEEKVVSLSIRKVNHEKLRSIASERKVSMSSIVDEFIEDNK